MGGNAFKEITRSINASEILDTLRWLEDNWTGANISNIPLWQRLLGSAGKKAASGDLDLNIDEELYNINIVKTELETLLGADKVKHHSGLNQLYTAVPINGNRNNGFVQIDFMFGKYNWQRFSYYAPSDGTGGVKEILDFDSTPLAAISRYKGVHRTELLKAITAFCSDWVLEDDTGMIARVGPTFLHDKGAVWRYRYRPFKKNSTTERVKALKEISASEFKELYPSSMPALYSVIDDPSTLLLHLFGMNMEVSDCRTFEYLWMYVNSRFNPDQRRVIANIYVERLNNLKVSVPSGLNPNFKRV